MDIQYMLQLIPVFLEKLPFTLGIIAVSFAFGLALAFAVTLGRINRVPVLGRLLDVYVSFIRCVPSVLLLFLVYYGLPAATQFFFSIRIDHLDKLVFGIISIILFNGGYMSEILRAAFLAIEEEQNELADSLGYTYGQKLRYVLVPQAIPICLPDLRNALINIMKDTSLFFTIGIVDLMALADIHIANNYGLKQAEVYLSVGVVYWLCSLLLTSAVHFIERKWAFANPVR